MSQAEDIKSKLDLVEIIREYVQLKAVGVNFQARCPFHREKTPSFVVSPERQIWKCFGCGKGGDVFSFVMEIEGLSFIESLRQLAPKAGIQLARYNPQETSKRNRSLDIMDMTVNYFHKLLAESPQAQSAREYLNQRGLTDETIREFKIGYSLDSWNDLNLKLKQKGFNDQEIFLAGMAVKKENANSYYDRFRGRIMFVINDYNGNPVAFSARVSPQKEQAEVQGLPAQEFRAGKYINSPQTPIYDKSKILFGLDKAKQFIREEDTTIVVEGQMDVISSYQAGVKNVVASSGTALSPEQIKLIKRYTDNILFSFDMDEAGQIAAERGIEQALAQDMNIKIIQIPGGKDPDDCIRNSIEDWKQAIKNASSVMDYYFDKTFTNLDLNEIANKKQAAAKLLKVIINIKNIVEQDTWIMKLADRLEIGEQVLREAISKAKNKKQTPAQNKSTADFTQSQVKTKTHEEMLAESLLALTIKHWVNFGHIIDQVEPDVLGKNICHNFYKKLIIYYNNSNNQTDFNYQYFKEWLKNNIEDEQELINFSDLVDTLTLLAEKDFYNLDLNQARVEINKIIIQLKRKYLIKKMVEIEHQINQAERQKDLDKVNALLEEFKFIAEEVKNLD